MAKTAIGVMGRRSAMRLLVALASVPALLPLARLAHAAGESAGLWVCTNADCDPYVYDPAVGDPDNIADASHPIPPGTPFEDLPESWICPLCASPKSWFRAKG